MSYEDDKAREEQEARNWWDEHGSEVDPVVEDEINGDDVVSLEDLQDQEYESSDSDDDE